MHPKLEPDNEGPIMHNLHITSSDLILEFLNIDIPAFMAEEERMKADVEKLKKEQAKSSSAEPTTDRVECEKPNESNSVKEEPISQQDLKEPKEDPKHA